MPSDHHSEHHNAPQHHPPQPADFVVSGDAQRLQRHNPMATTSSGRALWSALVALGIVAVMFAVFYDLSSRRDQRAAGPNVAAPQTTGQGNTQRPDR